MITLVPLCTMTLMLGKAVGCDDGAVVLIRYAVRLLFVPGRVSVAFMGVSQPRDPRSVWGGGVVPSRSA